MNPPTHHWRSLRTRVTLLTLAIFLIAMWPLAFYASHMLRQDMQHQLGEQHFSMATYIAAGINEELTDRLKALEFIAEDISPAMMNKSADLQAFLKQKQIVQGLFNGGTFITRPDGTVTASTPLSAQRVGINFMDRDFISGALHNGKAIIGRPVLGRALPGPVFAMAVPIRNAQGTVVGALAGVTKLSTPNFLDKITKGSYAKSGAYLLGAPQHKLFVTASDKSRILRALPAPGVNLLHDRFAQGFEGYGVMVNFRGEEVLAAAKRIPVAGWFIGIELPTAEAFAPIRAMEQRMFLATLLLTLLASGLTWWMLSRQLAPMLTAARTLARMSDTNQPPQLLVITRQDEIGQLIAGFNRLLETLAQRADAMKELQTQIKLAAQVFAQGREGITIADAQGQIVMVNKAFAVISGYTEAELIGKNSRILSSGRHDAAFYRAMWDAINTQNFWSGEIWDRRKNGSEFAAWLTISPMRDELGKITHYLGTFSDLTEVKAAESRIQWMSHFDALTGLPNRALLKDRTIQTISAMQRANAPLTMMLIGIDHFKEINDSLGYQVGNELLTKIAKRLTAAVREQDTVARWAGKEFVLVLPLTPVTGAAHLAAELLLKLAQPYQIGSHDLTLTASIGIASYPDNGSDFNSLFQAMEIALHRAQFKGRDNFQFYCDDMYQQVLARNQLTKALRHAAALEQLQLMYQPLVDMKTGTICGMEALLRWHHPELGSISPTQFIPVAEESGLIAGIGEWVLRRACCDIRAWLDKGIRVPPVAINVSPLQFHNPELIGQVKKALADFKVDPALIYIELTEGALMNDVPQSEAMLHELKNLGVRLSLDDFGTGYSSLSYLKRFPFDKVKIDQSFVRDVTTNPSDKVLVKVIVSMAHGLGMKVIAEGVETEAQCEIMRTSVCDEIQGYFFSRPVLAPAIEALIAEGRQLPPHLLRLPKPQRTLLLVDDEPSIVASLKRIFRRDGHLILTANSGAEGLDVLSRHKVDVILSDQRMPGMTGVEFLRAAKVNHPDTIRMVLSGYTELQSVTDAINEGAVYRFFTKPWDDEHLREQVQKAFEYKGLQEENQQLDIRIRSTNQELVAANRQLSALLNEKRDPSTHDQSPQEITLEALRHLPLPVLGVDDNGRITFVNTAAERCFASAGALAGSELAATLPAIDAAIAATAQGVPCELLIDQTLYLVEWNSMAATSPSRGRIVTLSEKGRAHETLLQPKEQAQHD